MHSNRRTRYIDYLSLHLIFIGHAYERLYERTPTPMLRIPICAYKKHYFSTRSIRLFMSTAFTCCCLHFIHRMCYSFMWQQISHSCGKHTTFILANLHITLFALLNPALPLLRHRVQPRQQHLLTISRFVAAAAGAIAAAAAATDATGGGGGGAAAAAAAAAIPITKTTP